MFLLAHSPRPILLFLVSCACLLQANAQPGKSAAVVRRVEVVRNNQGLSLEVISSRPINPRVTRLQDPPRVVIDLPGAVFTEGQKRIPVHLQGVVEVRASQWQLTPPVARVVVQLTTPRDYAVVASGNKLSVWLTPSVARAQPPAEPPPAA